MNCKKKKKVNLYAKLLELYRAPNCLEVLEVRVVSLEHENYPWEKYDKSWKPIWADALHKPQRRVVQVRLGSTRQI